MPRRHWTMSTALALALLGTQACGGMRGLGSCDEHLRGYSVSYFGGAQGSGRISLSATPGQVGSVSLELALFAPDADPAAAPSMRLDGIGSCSNGTARIRFGSSGENEQFKVLGGSMVGVFEGDEQPFGRWQVEVFDKREERELSLFGFWQADDPLGTAQGESDSSRSAVRDSASSS